MPGDSAFERFLHEKLKVPKHQTGLVLTYGIAGIAIIGGGAYAAGQWFGHEALGGKEAQAKAKAEHVVRWGSGHDADGPPHLIDLNKDGTEDYVGIFEGEVPEGRYLGAFDGKTGAMKWRAGGTQPKLEFFGDRRHFAVAGGYVVAIHGRDTTATIVGVSDGKLQHTLAGLPNFRGSLCPAPDDKPEIWGSFDGGGLHIDLKAGAKKAMPRPAWCTGAELHGDMGVQLLQKYRPAWPNSAVMSGVVVEGLHGSVLRYKGLGADPAELPLASKITATPCKSPGGDSLYLPQGNGGQLLVVKTRKLTQTKRPQWCPEPKQKALSASPDLPDKVDGATTHRGLWDGKHFIVTGLGRGAAYVFGLSPENKQKLWEKKIDGTNGYPSDLHLAAGRLGVIYYANDINKPALLVLDAKSGRVLWEKRQLPFIGNMARRVRMGKTHVFMPWRDGLKVFEAQNGKFVGDVGTGQRWAQSE